MILSFVAPDAATVDAWHAHLVAQSVTIFRPLGTSEKIGVHGFMALDPEGYTLEFEAFTDQPMNAEMRAATDSYT